MPTVVVGSVPSPGFPLALQLSSIPTTNSQAKREAQPMPVQCPQGQELSLLQSSLPRGRNSSFCGVLGLSTGWARAATWMFVE